MKSNQPTLLNDCKESSSKNEANDVYQEQFDKKRNRIESRKVEIFTEFKITAENKWGEHIKAIIKVTREKSSLDTKIKQWKDSQEIAYYISTAIYPAKFVCESIRNHWGIENSNHHVKDVTLKEDKSRIRINPNIMAKLRSFTLNIFRINNVKNVSDELWINSLNVENIFNYKGILR